MDSIRVTKVGNVKCSKTGNTLMGTIHLTAHHLIFRYDEGTEEEMWVPYPLISLVMRLPQTLQGHYPLSFYCRTFEAFSLTFERESDMVDVFESVKELTVTTSASQLYAFFYTPNPPFTITDGWSIYSPREEFGRMGVGTRTKAWRFTDINKEYAFCPSYPSRLVVPTRISDTTLQYASKYRSKCRIPALTYLHWANYGSITRSSQPMVGITQNRSIQDEKLIESIFQSHYSPESRASNGPIYGATATNLIIDARPTANAVANTAKGAGTENMDHYKDGKKVYMGIDNIHVMRESLAKIVEVLREADNTVIGTNGQLADEVPGQVFLDRLALRRSGWLRHIKAMLEGSVVIARNVHINSSHVLIHCSDGWDRTAQLCALSQIILDPYYRTMRGFQILIEKDWLSFGYKFMDRCGHLSSDKFFVSPTENFNAGGGADAAQAFLASVQHRFASQHHLKETSPVFHQFLEAVRQIQRQFPDRFEFNQRFLKQLYYHLYSCQFGTFLYNCERERRVGDGGPPPCELTVSVWDFFNSPSEREKNTNHTYDPSLDDPTSREPNTDMGVLFPNTKDVRFWYELYGRTDEEMNGRIVAAQSREIEFVGLVDGTEDDPVFTQGTPLTTPLPPSPAKSAPLMLPSSSPSSRSGSPSVVAVSRELSASLPDIASRGGKDNSRLFSSTSTISPNAQTASPIGFPNSPYRPRTNKPAEFLTSTGVKSVWGKLSSNASAAFSVVQDAYVGVAKDFKALGSSDGEKTAELRSRDSLSAWGEAEPSTSRGAAPTYTIDSSSNPWASTRARPSSASLPFDNPWSSVRSSSASPRHSNPIGELYGSSPLPSDPTVAPSLMSTESYGPNHRQRRETTPTPLHHIEGSSAKPLAAPPSPAVGSTDPLGVGPL